MSNVIELHKNKETDSNLSKDNLSEEGFNAENLEMIKRGITGGLGMLDKCVEDGDLSPEMNTAMYALQKTLKNLNDLVGLIEHDMVGMIGGVESLSAGQFTTQAHLQVLIHTLKAKEVVTDKDLETTWNELVPPMIEKMKSQS